MASGSWSIERSRCLPGQFVLSVDKAQGVKCLYERGVVSGAKDKCQDTIVAMIAAGVSAPLHIIGGYHTPFT